MYAAHVDRYLGELAHGKLDEPVERRVKRHVAVCARCRRTLKHLRQVVDRMPAIILEREPPPHVVAKDLNESHGVARFLGMAEPLAEVFGLPAGAAGELLATLDEPDAWRATGYPGVEVRKVECGGNRVGSDAHLVRAQTSFPMHTHAGDETMLVLQGGFSDSDGDEAWRGDLFFRPQGTSHSLKALEGPACIVAVCVSPPR